MKHNTILMLDALAKYSANPQTRFHADAILAGREVPLGEHYYSAEELAAKGTLGGFLEAVMKGDYEWARVKADSLNQIALDMVDQKLLE